VKYPYPCVVCDCVRPMKHDTLHTVLLCVYDTNKDEGVGGTNDEKHDRCRTGLQDQDRYSCTRAWGWHGVCSWPLCPIESSQSFLPKFPGSRIVYVCQIPYATVQYLQHAQVSNHLPGEPGSNLFHAGCETTVEVAQLLL